MMQICKKKIIQTYNIAMDIFLFENYDYNAKYIKIIKMALQKINYC
jgi:hypothetical protein